jgi:hypothetical membrane protein
MNLEKWKRIAGISEILGSLLFMLLIVVAMFFFAGGTMDNPSAPGYSFWGNTISDLGRTISYNDKFNIISMILFTFALASLAFLSLPLYLVFPKLFSTRRLESISAKIGSVLGFITTTGWIGIIFTPADIANGPHWLFAYVMYIALFFSGVFYTISLFVNPKMHKGYAIIFAIYCIILFTSLMVIVIGTPKARIYLVVSQKIAHIASTIGYIVLGYGILKYKIN